VEDQTISKAKEKGSTFLSKAQSDKDIGDPVFEGMDTGQTTHSADDLLGETPESDEGMDELL